MRVCALVLLLPVPPSARVRYGMCETLQKSVTGCDKVTLCVCVCREKFVNELESERERGRELLHQLFVSAGVTLG